MSENYGSCQGCGAVIFEQQGNPKENLKKRKFFLPHCHTIEPPTNHKFLLVLKSVLRVPYGHFILLQVCFLLMFPENNLIRDDLNSSEREYSQIPVSSFLRTLLTLYNALLCTRWQTGGGLTFM